MRTTITIAVILVALFVVGKCDVQFRIGPTQTTDEGGAS
jgi:hypothetical protein